MAEKLRTFIAIDTPPEFKIQVERIQQELAVTNAPVRWDKAYKLHLTLKFLGKTDLNLIQEISAKLKIITSEYRPFWLKYESLGCFPNKKNPRIIWIGCIPLSSTLDHIYEDIEKFCTQLGFEAESRQFHPHITIGRIRPERKGKTQKFNDLINRMESITFESIESEVHSIVLMKSELLPTGSEYSIIEQFPLTK